MKTLALAALSLSLAACTTTPGGGAGQVRAALSLSYAKTGAGVYNDARYGLGKVFRWTPGQTPDDLANVPIRPASLAVTDAPGARNTASNVTGTVVSLNVAASEAVKAQIAANASARTAIEYTSPTTRDSSDTRGAMADFIETNPPEVAADWGLDAAVAANAAGANGPFYVIVFKTIETDSTTLKVDGSTGSDLSIGVPGFSTDVTVSFKKELLAECTGRQPCLFDVRIYRPVINAARRYDFRQVPGLRDAFLADLRRTTQ